MFKGISQASFGPIVEKWSTKVFDKAVELVIETPFGLNHLTEDVPDLWEVLAHWCHVLCGSPSVSLNLFL